ncbi:hypothetical protein EDB89DRAFT_2248528 [Lactarius sanguifluus]|nr:hypothetical protein EDB89DRAFT_2248528 [Lactarius sanguifluus]
MQRFMFLSNFDRNRSRKATPHEQPSTHFSMSDQHILTSQAIIPVKLLSEGWRLWIDALPGRGDVEHPGGGLNILREEVELRIDSRGLSFVGVRPEEHESNQRRKDPNEQRKRTTTCEWKCASSTESVRSLIPPFLSAPARWSIDVSARRQRYHDPKTTQPTLHHLPSIRVGSCSLSVVGVRPEREGELQLGYTPKLAMKRFERVKGTHQPPGKCVENMRALGNVCATRLSNVRNERSSNRVWDARTMFRHVPRRTLKNSECPSVRQRDNPAVERPTVGHSECLMIKDSDTPAFPTSDSAPERRAIQRAGPDDWDWWVM